MESPWDGGRWTLVLGRSRASTWSTSPKTRSPWRSPSSSKLLRLRPRRSDDPPGKENWWFFIGKFHGFYRFMGDFCNKNGSTTRIFQGWNHQPVVLETFFGNLWDDSWRILDVMNFAGLPSCFNLWRIGHRSTPWDREPRSLKAKWLQQHLSIVWVACCWLQRGQRHQYPCMVIPPRPSTACETRQSLWQHGGQVNTHQTQYGTLG